ncbi:GNAT family N-acetyltransferase [Enterobacter sp. Cy-643]|uniref:GNAT family N-acetyltransferase n=1 Tax=Enterobacter sp. Cy-643 TaxID=2608346 RepID=UPI00256FB01D|nr:GNAT family N-acetyltransferase [Enterobacter sp. Cy-643]
MVNLPLTDLNIYPASSDDAQMLADIRVESMRPSLEALNRFDPVRARDRFLSTFEENDTFILSLDGEVAGFYVLRTYPEYLYLDHFYIKKQFQEKGIGSIVMKGLKVQASTLKKPIRLIALKESPANAFYLSQGFIFERAEGVDRHYFWALEEY